MPYPLSPARAAAGVLAIAYLLTATAAPAMTVRYTNNAIRVIPADTRAAIDRIVADTETEARRAIPDLSRDVVLIVDIGRNVMESGEIGVTLSPTLVRWTVDASRAEGVLAIAKAHLRARILHESHHLVRGWFASGVDPSTYFMDAVIAEGLATAFAREVTGSAEAWGVYPADIPVWTAELMRVPDAEAFDNISVWMLEHPDGRTYVGYKVGTFLVDQATKRSGRSAAALVNVPTDEVIRLAGF